MNCTPHLQSSSADDLVLEDDKPLMHLVTKSDEGCDDVLPLTYLPGRQKKVKNF